MTLLSILPSQGDEIMDYCSENEASEFSRCVEDQKAYKDMTLGLMLVYNKLFPEKIDSLIKKCVTENLSLVDRYYCYSDETIKEIKGN
jgi:hypothetical protein